MHWYCLLIVMVLAVRLVRLLKIDRPRIWSSETPAFGRSILPGRKLRRWPFLATASSPWARMPRPTPGEALVLSSSMLPGTRLLPGFNDAHVHFLDGGAQLESVELKDAASPQEFARRIGLQAAKTPKGAWVLNGEWDETKWTPAALPTKELIDPETPDTPVAVSRYDGHMVVANSLALKLAGITARTPDPPGGVIVRDARGNPTGAIKDAAMDILFKAVPAPSHVERRRYAESALGMRPQWA